MRISQCLVAATILLSMIARAQHAPARPNIIFILTDNQRRDALSCMGHPFFKCPNTDRIANEGAKFMNYFVTIPLCSPSRAVILSGQYSHKNGINDPSNKQTREQLQADMDKLVKQTS